MDSSPEWETAAAYTARQRPPQSGPKMDWAAVRRDLPEPRRQPAPMPPLPKRTNPQAAAASLSSAEHGPPTWEQEEILMDLDHFFSLDKNWQHLSSMRTIRTSRGMEVAVRRKPDLHLLTLRAASRLPLCERERLPGRMQRLMPTWDEHKTRCAHHDTPEPGCALCACREAVRSHE